jgi:hypothetical protein
MDAGDPQPRLFAEMRAHVDAHPWQLVGGAALAGAWFALGRAPTRSRRTLGELAVTAIVAIAWRIARDAAIRRIGDAAMRWWDETV